MAPIYSLAWIFEKEKQIHAFSAEFISASNQLYMI